MQPPSRQRQAKASTRAVLFGDGANEDPLLRWASTRYPPPVTFTPDLPADEELFRRIVEESPAAVLLLTNEHVPRVLYASPRVEELTGFPAEEMRRHPRLWFSRLHDDDAEAISARWNHAVDDAAAYKEEYRFLHRNGEWRVFRDRSTPVREADGSIRYRQNYTEDITSERFAEEQAQRSEARYRALVEHLPVIVYVDSDEAEPRSLYVSPNSREILGYDPGDFLADPALWFDSMHPGDLPRVRAAWAEAIATRQPFHAEYRDVKPDGTVVWVRDDSMLVRGDEDEPLFWQGVLLDITAEREATRDLRRSETRYRTLVDQVPAIMYEMGPDDERRTLFVSPHVEEILGYPRQEWLDQPDIWVELLHPDHREQELAAHDLHNETGEPWQREYRLIASDGREVWVRDHAELVTDPDGPRWLGVMLDISPQKQAEEMLRLANEELEMRVLTRTAELEDANEMMNLEIGERRRVETELRAAEERLRAVIEHLPGVIYTWRVPTPEDSEHTQTGTYTSPQIEDLLGFTPEEWDGRFWETRVHPHDRERVLASAQRSRETGALFDQEFRYLDKAGRVVWVLERAALLSRDEGGRARWFQGMILDISDRKAAEANAAEAEERFRAVLEDGPVATYVYELLPGDPPRAAMRYLSPQIGEMVGYPVSHWAGRPEVWLEMTHPDDRDQIVSAFANWTEGRPWNLQYRVIAADGRIVWLLDRGRTTEHHDDGTPRVFQGAIVDITELKEELEALRAQESALRSIVETTPAVPWTEMIDPRTGRARFTYIGPEAQAVFGYTAEELMAETAHFTRLVHPDDRARVLAASERCEQTGDPWNELYRVLHRDGSVRWVLSCGRHTADSPSTWHGTTIDVTRHIEHGTLPLRVGEATPRG
jgi:adenylate cyclase